MTLNIGNWLLGAGVFGLILALALIFFNVVKQRQFTPMQIVKYALLAMTVKALADLIRYW